jgi:hypothetical protein
MAVAESVSKISLINLLPEAHRHFRSLSDSANAFVPQLSRRP